MWNELDPQLEDNLVPWKLSVNESLKCVENRIIQIVPTMISHLSMAEFRNITMTTKQQHISLFSIYLQIYSLKIFKLPDCFITLLRDNFRERSQAHIVQAGAQEWIFKNMCGVFFKISRLIRTSWFSLFRYVQLQYMFCMCEIC